MCAELVGAHPPSHTTQAPLLCFTEVGGAQRERARTGSQAAVSPRGPSSRTLNNCSSSSAAGFTTDTRDPRRQKRLQQRSRLRKGQKRQILSANYPNTYSHPQVRASLGQGAGSGRGRRSCAPGESGPGARREAEGLVRRAGPGSGGPVQGSEIRSLSPPLRVPRLLLSEGGGAVRALPSPGPPRPLHGPESEQPRVAPETSPLHRAARRVAAGLWNKRAAPAKGPAAARPSESHGSSWTLSGCRALCARRGAGRTGGPPHIPPTAPRSKVVAGASPSRTVQSPAGRPFIRRGVGKLLDPGSPCS